MRLSSARLYGPMSLAAILLYKFLWRLGDIKPLTRSGRWRYSRQSAVRQIQDVGARARLDARC